MTVRIERRTVSIDRLGALELRAADSGVRTLAGHAAVFDTWTELWGGVRERVAPGAFARAVKEDDVRGLFNHDPNYVLGRNTAKTLRLREDKSGLAFEVDLPDTSYARDLTVCIERGDITGCSFGFITLDADWEKDGMERTLREVQLFDVGPVTFPAYDATDVEARSLFEAIAKQERAKIEVAVGLSTDTARRRLALTEME